MEKKHFVPVTKRVGVALAATALLAVGVACTSATQGETSPNSSQTSAIETPVLREDNLIKTGQWGYMPGAELKPEGLHIEHRGFQIIQQDGSGGQPNPPVNEYGTYLNVPKDFMLRFRVSDIKGPASIQFYENPPIVSDEFRVEPKSIRLTFDGQHWTLKRWDGNGQNDLANQVPSAEQTFSSSSGDQQIEFVHKDGDILLSANGVELGHFNAGDTFADGKLWFGADAEAEGGHFTIQEMEATGKDHEVTAVDVSKLPAVKKQSDGLQELVTKHRNDFRFGANMALWAMVSNRGYHDRMFGGDFGVITPENAGKWQFTEPLPGVYDFSQLDAIVAEARKNNVKIHGHTLSFGEALPRWLSDMPTDSPEQKAAVQRVYTNHIVALVKHFAGVIDVWDMNEIFAESDNNGNVSQLFKDNVLYRAMGPNYVPIGIKAAVGANAKVQISINEYGTENDDGMRTSKIQETVKGWVRQGLPIKYFGYQSHIYEPETDNIVQDDGTAPVFEENLRTYKSFGVDGRVSELDAPADQRDYKTSSQSRQFVGMAAICIRHAECKELGTWSNGPSDVYQDDTHHLLTGVDSMFDANMRPQPSYYALQKYLQSLK